MGLTLTPTRIERMALRKHNDAGISRSTTELRGHKTDLALSPILQSTTSLRLINFDFVEPPIAMYPHYVN